MIRRPVFGVLILVLLLAPVPAAGQPSESSRPLAWEVTRAVLIDPTTYAPAVIAHEAMMKDWKTSQVLFANGWVEANPRFTASGLPNDAPISYGVGARRITHASLEVFAYSAFNNAAAGVAERLLIARYPARKRLIRSLSWIERIAYASLIAYRNSADHFRQSSENRRLAREFGLTR